MKYVLTTLARSLTAAFLFVLATVLAGGVLTGFGLTFPEMTKTVSPAAFMLGIALGALVVAGFFVPLVRGAAGSTLARITLVAGFLLLTCAVNGAIEGLTFTTVLRREHVPALLIQGLVSWTVMAAALVFLWKPEGTQAGPRLSPALSHSWWRWVLAWLCWPFTYYLFGMMVAPIVINSYLGGIPGLRIPAPEVILFTQLGRSVIFLAATVPFLPRWTGSRTGLIVALGLAHWAAVGLYGLLPPSDFGPLLRTVHSIEIGLDSFLYSWFVVALLQPRPKTASAPLAAAA